MINYDYMKKLWTPWWDNPEPFERFHGAAAAGRRHPHGNCWAALSFTRFATSRSKPWIPPCLFSPVLCALGAFGLIGMALQPSSETSSISQRLEGLKATIRRKRAGGTTLRDQDEMSKSLFVRMILPMVDRWSKFFSSLTPATSLQSRAEVSIVQAGMQGKVTPGQITSFSYILMIGYADPVCSPGFGLPDRNC